MADKKDEKLNETGFPEGWVPVDSQPIIPGHPTGAPPQPNAMANYFQGSISPSLQHDSVFVGTRYGSPGIPSVGLMPIPLSGNPVANSAIANHKSSATPTPPTPAPTPAVNSQMFTVNGNTNLLAVGKVNGIPV